MRAYVSAVSTNIGASGLALYHRAYSCPGNWAPEYIYYKSLSLSRIPKLPLREMRRGMRDNPISVIGSFLETLVSSNY